MKFSIEGKYRQEQRVKDKDSDNLIKTSKFFGEHLPIEYMIKVHLNNMVATYGKSTTLNYIQKWMESAKQES